LVCSRLPARSTQHAARNPVCIGTRVLNSKSPPIFALEWVACAGRLSLSTRLNVWASSCARGWIPLPPFPPPHTHARLTFECVGEQRRARLDRLWRVLRLLVAVVPSSSECPLVREIYRHQARHPCLPCARALSFPCLSPSLARVPSYSRSIGPGARVACSRAVGSVRASGGRREAARGERGASGRRETSCALVAE